MKFPVYCTYKNKKNELSTKEFKISHIYKTYLFIENMNILHAFI